MDSAHCKVRMNVEDDDRLSMLPVDLIHKILSFISIKHAVQTSVLSSRWRFIWTSMPDLDISIDDFRTSDYFSEFVNHVLSRRNNQIEVYSVKLTFHQTFSEALLKQILDYAFSHNVQRLSVSCLLKEETDFPLYLFRSRSLKYLSLIGCQVRFFEQNSIILVSNWELPALTTLHLDCVSFFEENYFSKCENLKNLTLNNFKVMESDSFTLTVSHPRLSSLTLEEGYWTPRVVNVVAPQLEKLTISSCDSKHLITAPNLSSLFIKNAYGYGFGNFHFSTDLPSLKKVDLCISSIDKRSGCRIAALFQQIHNVKFLTLNLEFIKPFITYMEGISLQPSPFSNLKRLKIYPVYVPSDDDAHKRVIMSTKVLNYLLDGSPSPTLTLISYEEIKEERRRARAIANAVEAQKLMENLQGMLEKETTNIETNRHCMRIMKSQEENSTDEEENDTNDEGKAPVEKMQLDFKRKMTQMKRCWEDVGVHIGQGKRKACSIISQLRDIEVLLLEDLPTSKRDELQACFSSLRVEVDAFVKKILHHMMIPQIQLSDCFNELVTSLPS